MRVDNHMESLRVTLEGFYEIVVDRNGQVVVGELLKIRLDIDEGQDIRVIHAHDPHVGPPPKGSLLNGFRYAGQHL